MIVSTYLQVTGSRRTKDINFIMDSSRKSLRALSVAQSIKKEIDETLFKVELEKRKFLTLEREETHLQDSYSRKLKLLNEHKAREPETKTHSTRAWQTKNIIGNVDRNTLILHDNIQKLKADITIHRRQVFKFKEMNGKLEGEVDSLLGRNEETNGENLSL